MARMMRRYGEELLVAGVIALAVSSMVWGMRHIAPPRMMAAAAPAADEDLRDALADARPATELDKLFNSGVDAYVRRDMAGARLAFAGMLRKDPKNVEAKNALRRVSRETR